MAAVNQEYASAPAKAASPVSVDVVDARMVALMRCVLAISGLAIIYVDPTEPTRLVELTYISLSAYCVWSIVQLAGALTGTMRQSPWIDVAWATYLVALTQGTSSIFFFLYVFAIVVAASSGGYRIGMQVTVASSVLFLAVGILAAPIGEAFELNRSLIRPIYMLAIGWMMSVWGGRSIMQRRRLALLRDVSAQWNPRLGVTGIVHSNLTRLADFFAGKESLLAIRRPADPPDVCVVYRVSRGAMAMDTTDLHGAAAMPFVAGMHLPARRYGSGRAEPPQRGLANLLEATAYVDAPYSQGDGSVGRLIVTRESGGFSDEDANFVEQVALALSHVVENTRLIEELFLKAAEHERFRISLDIHDSTVQPYIGLKLGLDALYRAAQDNPLHGRLGDLLEMANTTIRDLRGFATGIRERAPISGESLVNAIHEQAERFKRFYAIDVRLECSEDLFVSPSVASEAFRVVSEGLSNIMRHTTARFATVRLSRSESELRILIANGPWGPRCVHPLFTPRSINSRALALGGSSFVEQGENGSSAVHICIPV